MSLSVYTIKHPLLMNWTNYILNNTLTESEQFTIINKIGIALIYEVTRKCMTMRYLYLQKIDEIVEVNILPSDYTYSIITDIYLSQILSKDITNLIPMSTIYPLYYQDTELILSKTYKKNTKNEKIIFIEKDLNANIVIEILDKILSHYIIKQTIEVCCMTCKTSTLQVLGARYSNLNIYTAQIINDNNS